MKIKALLTFLLQRVFILSHGQISALLLTSTEIYHHQFHFSIWRTPGPDILPVFETLCQPPTALPSAQEE